VSLTVPESCFQMDGVTNLEDVVSHNDPEGVAERICWDAWELIGLATEVMPDVGESLVGFDVCVHVGSISSEQSH
jgi:hypothetical protein